MSVCQWHFLIIHHQVRERERGCVFIFYYHSCARNIKFTPFWRYLSLSLCLACSLYLSISFSVLLTIQLSLGNALFYCYCYSVSQLKTRKCMMCVGKKLTSIGIGNNSINRTIITSQRLEKMKEASRAQCENIAWWRGILCSEKWVISVCGCV